MESHDPALASSMRQISRVHYGEIWRRGKSGAELSGEDATLYQTMLEHKEYYDFWEHAVELGDREIEADGQNPFLHVALHLVIEQQIVDRNPPEVDQAIFRLARAGMARHDALHEIGRVFSGMFWEVLKDRKHFDKETYRRRLCAIKP